jgi:hypothetical protein
MVGRLIQAEVSSGPRSRRTLHEALEMRLVGGEESLSPDSLQGLGLTVVDGLLGHQGN